MIFLFHQVTMVFQESWKKKNDCNGTSVGDWLQKSTKGSFYFHCQWCKVDLNCDKGFEKLQQQAKTAKHRDHATNPPKKSTQLTIEKISNFSVRDGQGASSLKTGNIDVVTGTVGTNNSQLIQSQPQSVLKLFNPR